MTGSSKDTLHALISGERRHGRYGVHALAHLHGCATCRKEVRALLVVYAGLSSCDAPGACPSIEELEAHLTGALDQPSALRVSPHVEECPRCREFMETLRASQDPVADLVRREERLFVLAQTEERGRRPPLRRR